MPFRTIASAMCGRPPLGETADGVVVGDPEGREPGLNGQLHELRRRQRTVRSSSVGVEVDHGSVLGVRPSVRTNFFRTPNTEHPTPFIVSGYEEVANASRLHTLVHRTIRRG